MKQGKITPYLFLLPGCVILGAFIFYPMLQAIWLSFTNYNMVTEAEFIGTENYQNLFEDELFWKVLGQTLLYLVIVVPALVILPIFIAILVNQQIRGIAFSGPPITYLLLHQWSLSGLHGNGCTQIRVC